MLESLLREVVDGALVPLINSSLSQDEVEKLANLKGIQANTNNEDSIVVKEEPKECSFLEAVPVKSSIIDEKEGSDSDSSAIISSDKEDFTESKDAKALPEVMLPGCIVCEDNVRTAQTSGPWQQ